MQKQAWILTCKLIFCLCRSSIVYFNSMSTMNDSAKFSFLYEEYPVIYVSCCEIQFQRVQISLFSQYFNVTGPRVAPLEG